MKQELMRGFNTEGQRTVHLIFIKIAPPIRRLRYIEIILKTVLIVATIHPIKVLTSETR